MGKGKRDRETRKQAVDPGEALDLLLEVETKDEFLALVADRPELIGAPVSRRLSNMAAAPYGDVFKRWERLVSAARQDPVAAWDAHAETLARDNATGEELGRLVEEIREADGRQEPERVIELSESAVPRAMEAELTPMVSILEAFRAQAFLKLPTGNRQDNIDKAIAGFGAALSTTVVPEEAARLHMYLGMAMAERLRDDPADNHEAALNAMRDGLRILPADGSPELRATMKGNIATTLLRRQRGEKIGDLTEARDLCREVLDYNTLEDHPDEWATVQLNYAPILQELADLGEGDPGDSEAIYQEVIDAAGVVAEDKVANAHHQLGRTLRIRAQFDPERLVNELDLDGRDEKAAEAEEAENHRLLVEAREHLETAVELYPRKHQPLAVGRAFTELADVLNQLSELHEAKGAAEAGLELLSPTSAPRECARVGGRLGDLLAKEGAWEHAAAAFRVAVEASEIALNSRLDSEHREQEAKSTLNLTRWAAFAVAAAGEVPEALMILESGRARDLRLRLGPGEEGAAELSELPENLRARYVAATDELARSPLGQAGAAAARSLREVLRDIRDVPDFERFATRPNEFDLATAAAEDWPVLYVNPTPAGTMLLVLGRDGEGATADVRFLEQPTSLDVFMRLLAGVGVGDLDLAKAAEHGSFLAGASGFAGAGANRDVQKDVEDVLPWLGEALAAPIHELLTEIGARGVTLVSCGPVGLAPLHCAPWSEGGQSRCLIDDFEIRHAASGTFAAASLSRAEEREGIEPSLVALVDPERNLPAAQAEFDGVRPLFGQRVESAGGTSADWSFLRTHAQTGTYLHLACHARSGVWGETVPAVMLADGPAEMTQLTELAQLPSRLVTVSACQSAVVDITLMPEEGISVATALLAAGAACVIASLWPVRDDTTALLMTRLYKEMIEGGLRPPEALRRAQIWLRDLTDPELDAFLADYPSLAAEFARRQAMGDRPGRRASGGPRRSGGLVERPFADADYWAPFIAIGA